MSLCSFLSPVLLTCILGPGMVRQYCTSPTKLQKECGIPWNTSTVHPRFSPPPDLYRERLIPSPQIGMVAHSTPFLTGRPYTLFYGREIVSSGAVGLCIHPGDSHRSSVAVQFPDLRPVTPVLTITEYLPRLTLLPSMLMQSTSAQRGI